MASYRKISVGIDSDAASDVFAVLANREHRLPTVIALQSGPAYWVEALPDQINTRPSGSRLDCPRWSHLG
jgi:hypothetical protein